MPRLTTLILAALFGTAAALAQAPIYRCIDSDGRPVLTDRRPDDTCRAITIDPYPVDDRAPTWYGGVTVSDLSTFGH